MYKNAYDYSNQELLEAYEREIAALAIQNSALVTDLAPRGNLDAIYLRGILLSRIEKEKRPFSRGDILQVKPQNRTLIFALNPNRTNYRLEGDSDDETFKVTRVYYLGYKMWAVSLEGHDNYCFPAERFLKISRKKQSIAA